MPHSFNGSICIRQRILAEYRVKFFELIAERCDGCTVIAGQSGSDEAVAINSKLKKTKFIPVKNVKRLSGVFENYRQEGLISHLQKIDPTVFITVSNPRLVDINKTIRFLRGNGIPSIGWGIGTTDFWNRPFKKLRHHFRKRMVNRFDGFVCYGSKAASQYAELGFPESRIFPIYNATMSRPDGDPPNRPDHFSHPPKILAIGRLIESKGFDRLIEAAAIVAGKGHKLQLQIVGDGPDLERLKGIAEQHDFSTEFLGYQSGDRLRRIGHNADLFVLPGLGGLSIQEAMTFGLPVIVTEADGTEIDLVKENGWIIEKENVNALAAGIERAVLNPARLRKMGRESFRIVKEEINLELMADRFINAVDAIVTMGIRRK